MPSKKSYTSLNPNTEILIKAAKALEPYINEIMFVGGSIVSLYINEGDKPRPTKDVDVVVQVATYTEYNKFIELIKKLGFKEDQSDKAPICRYLIDGLPVDFMPAEESVLGFKNKWFKQAMEHTRVFIIEGIEIKVISPVYLLAAKIESFNDRGKNDLLESKDAEDIISLIDGYAELLDEFEKSNEDVKVYISKSLNEIKYNAYFEYSIQDQVKYSNDVDKAREKLIAKIERITLKVL
jgi:predicted nucleotidyltransferase